MKGTEKLRSNTTTVIALVTAAVMLLSATFTSTSTDVYAQEKTLRIGYFPNINHAQAVIGLGNN